LLPVPSPLGTVLFALLLLPFRVGGWIAVRIGTVVYPRYHPLRCPLLPNPINKFPHKISLLSNKLKVKTPFPLRYQNFGNATLLGDERPPENSDSWLPVPSTPKELTQAIAELSEWRVG